MVLETFILWREIIITLPNQILLMEIVTKNYYTMKLSKKITVLLSIIFLLIGCNKEQDETETQESKIFFLQTQQEVSSFGQSNYQHTDFDIFIGYSNDCDITSLIPLNSLISVNSISIEKANLLENLDGLENINTITGDIEISHNSNLKDLTKAWKTPLL